MSNKVILKGTEVEHINTLLADPYFNARFKIHTNASSIQPKAVIIQEGKPITFYNSKLTVPQKIYIL